ncbi:hypothetical protein ACMSFX_26760, partial [Bacteroides thetaiotaomicron]
RPTIKPFTFLYAQRFPSLYSVITVESFSDRIKVCALDIIEIHTKKKINIYISYLQYNLDKLHHKMRLKYKYETINNM